MPKDYKKLINIFSEDPEMLKVLEARQQTEHLSDQKELLKELVKDKVVSDAKTKMVKIEYLKGEDGATPVKGQDYFTEEEVSKFKEEVTPIKGKDYRDGEPGYTPVKGVDFFDGKDGYVPIKGKDYFDGEDGRNPLTVSKTPPTDPKKGDLWYKD